MNITKYKLFLVYILLILSCGLSLVIHFNFRNIDRTPFAWDQISHLIFTMDYSDLLERGDYHGFFTYYNKWYTPLIYWLSSPFMSIISHNFLPLFINCFFLVVWIFTIAILFFKIKKDRNKPMFLPVLIIMIFHLVIPDSSVAIWKYISIREFWLDIPLSISLCCLYEVYYYFRKQKKISDINILTFSIFVLVVAYTKNTGFVYASPYILLFIIRIVSQRVALLNNVFQLLLFILVILYLSKWFYINRHELVANIDHARAVGLLEKDPQGVKGLITNIWWLYSFQPIVIAVFTILTIKNYILKPGKMIWNKVKIGFKNSIDIIIAIIFLLVIFSLFPNKEPRYILPLVWLVYYILLKKIAFRIPVNYYSIVVMIGSILLPLRTYNNLNKPRLDNFAYYYVNDFLNKIRPRTVSYFFEIDSPFFNYASSQYLSRINNVEHYYNTNSVFPFARDEDKYNCELTDEETYIIVYTGGVDYENWENDKIGFLKNCGKVISERCNKNDEISFSGSNEKLILFSCTQKHYLDVLW